MGKGLQIIGYGRSHWLYFVDGQLAEVTSQSQLFSYTFINQLAFEERFDDRTWLAGGLAKGQKVAADEVVQLEQQSSSAEARLALHTEVYLANNQQYKRREVTGFTLSQPQFSLPAAQIVAELSHHNDPFLKFVSAQLANSQPINVNAIPLSPDAMADGGGRTKLWLFGTNALASLFGDTLSTVRVRPDYFRQISNQAQRWQFGDFYHGQSLQAALDAAGEDAFYFRDSIEIDKHDHRIVLLLEQHEGELQVYGMDLSLYL